MDGSKRSGHGNAYFTGFGRAKRIVFFDTLLERLAPDEIEAVLAHELGHFKLKHVAKRIAWSAALSLAVLALLALLAREPWFYAGLGIPQALLPVAMDRPGVALELFLLALPVFTFVLEPLSAQYSRRHEFEADAFATRHASRGRAHAGAGQALRGQRGDADARSAALGVLRLAPAGRDPHRAHRGAGRRHAADGDGGMSSAHHDAADTKLLALAAMHCRAGAPRLGADERRRARGAAARDGRPPTVRCEGVPRSRTTTRRWRS